MLHIGTEREADLIDELELANKRIKDQARILLNKCAVIVAYEEFLSVFEQYRDSPSLVSEEVLLNYHDRLIKNLREIRQSDYTNEKQPKKKGQLKKAMKDIKKLQTDMESVKDSMKDFHRRVIRLSNDLVRADISRNPD